MFCAAHLLRPGQPPASVAALRHAPAQAAAEGMGSVGW